MSDPIDPDLFQEGFSLFKLCKDQEASEVFLHIAYEEEEAPRHGPG